MGELLTLNSQLLERYTALMAGARHQRNDANYQLYLQGCHLDTPPSQNQELRSNSANTYELKPISVIAPHITNLREQHLIWTSTHRNFAQALSTGEITSDQDTVFYFSTPQLVDEDFPTILNLYCSGSVHLRNAKRFSLFSTGLPNPGECDHLKYIW